MVELIKRPLVPFCVRYKGKEFDCLFCEEELYVRTAQLSEELGKKFPAKKFFVLGMERNIVGFTSIRHIRKKGASGVFFKFLSSVTPEEGYDALNRAFFK